MTQQEPDVRFYAHSTSGRQRLKASNLNEVMREIEESYYHRKTCRQVVKETREVVLDWRGMAPDPNQMELDLDD